MGSAGAITTGEVYGIYKELCRKTRTDFLTQRRVADLISELDMLGVITARVISKGRYGRTREIKMSSSSEDIINDYEILSKELRNFSEFLAKKEKIIGISKTDLLSQKEVEKLNDELKTQFDHEVIFFSSVSGYNIQKLLDVLWINLKP